MKRTTTKVIALLLAILLTLPLLASCGDGAAAGKDTIPGADGEPVVEPLSIHAAEVDGVPVYQQYKSRKVDLGLAETETFYDIIEIDGQLRATVGILDPNWDPDNPRAYRCKPYSTEYRWYSLDFVEDTAKREKTVAYHELGFPSDPNENWVFGGEPLESDEWGDGLDYHVYKDGVMQDDALYYPVNPVDFEGDADPMPYGARIPHMIVCGDTLFLTDTSAAYDEYTGFMFVNIDNYWYEQLYINGRSVDTKNWMPGDPHYNYKGMIGIRGEPYALLEIEDKGRLVPLTPESTEMTFDGVDIDGCPTGGAFDDGRFGYFMSDSELWRTDGKESQCIADLAPHGVTAISMVRSVRALSDGRLLVSADGKLIELSASDGSDIIPVCDIGIVDYDAGTGNVGDFNYFVSKYNDQAENFFVRVKEYRDISSLNLAMLSGEVDMVVTANRTALNNYIKQELLVPLEEAAPALFEKDVLIESVVNATKVDGVCYYLPVNFDLCGEYIADPSLLKDETPMKDRVAYYGFIKENDPEYFKTHTTYQILDNFANDLDEWIDWETNTCHFDDGTFAALLELCALGCTEEEYYDYDQLKASASPLAAWWSRDEKAGSFTLQDGVENYRFTDVESAQKFQKGLPAAKDRYAGPSTWVQVDFPMPSRVHKGYAIDAHTLYAIVDHEDTKAAAADFLRWLILEDVVEEFPQKETSGFRTMGWDGFSINKDETDRYLRRLIDDYVDPEEEAASVKPEVAAEFPSSVANLRYWAQYYDARCGQTQYEITWDYIEKADHLCYPDSELLRVIHNEANGFFTGSITAEKAADYIQNRISLYLAEQS